MKSKLVCVPTNTSWMIHSFFLFSMNRQALIKRNISKEHFFVRNFKRWFIELYPKNADLFNQKDKFPQRLLPPFFNVSTKTLVTDKVGAFEVGMEQHFCWFHTFFLSWDALWNPVGNKQCFTRRRIKCLLPSELKELSLSWAKNCWSCATLMMKLSFEFPTRKRIVAHSVSGYVCNFLGLEFAYRSVRLVKQMQSLKSSKIKQTLEKSYKNTKY